MKAPCVAMLTLSQAAAPTPSSSAAVLASTAASSKPPVRTVPPTTATVPAAIRPTCSLCCQAYSAQLAIPPPTSPASCEMSLIGFQPHSPSGSLSSSGSSFAYSYGCP